MHIQAKRMPRAFTLIEILIVVVILGILAAIVIPQFTDAADDANEASMRSQLQTVRSQIELFRAQGSQNLDGTSATMDPTDGWDELVNNDYLPSAPKNPYNGSNTVAATAGATVGWMWTTKIDSGGNAIAGASNYLYAVWQNPTDNTWERMPD